MHGYQKGIVFNLTCLQTWNSVFKMLLIRSHFFQRLFTCFLTNKSQKDDIFCWLLFGSERMENSWDVFPSCGSHWELHVQQTHLVFGVSYVKRSLFNCKRGIFILDLQICNYKFTSVKPGGYSSTAADPSRLRIRGEVFFVALTNSQKLILTLKLN